MVRKLAVGALILSGFALIALGAQRWLDHRAATRVVRSFLASLEQGEGEAVLLHLEPERRAAVEAEIAEESPGFWTPNTELTYRIHHLTIDGDRAAARLWIERNGFVIQPTLRLTRSATRLWKIHSVENLQVDPLWLDIKHQQAQAEGEGLAKELSDALKGRPGVTIEREPMPQPME